MGRIRLAIADSHHLFRECLATALAEEEGFLIVGAYRHVILRKIGR